MKEKLFVGVHIYSSWLRKYPLKTRAITTSILISLGDVIAQNMFNKGPFDWGRLGRAATLGFCFTGPSLFFWFNHILPRIMSIRGFATLGPKAKALVGTFIDQFIFSWWTITTYHFWANYLQFFSLRRAVDNVKEKLMPTILAAWIFWPLIIFSSLRWASIEYRVLMINIGSMFWNGFMSYINNGNKKIGEGIRTFERPDRGLLAKTSSTTTGSDKSKK